ncbi:MAG TPA: hypothetical protein PKZ12_06915 [Smithellaceae bacterium]|nr:hypothetical protein [Smithellaceae bacterium]
MAAIADLNTQLLDITDNRAILKEVENIISLINPRFDFVYLDKVFNDVEKLFHGNYPGFRECNTRYHDLRHTLTVFLAMARLIHGAGLEGINFTDKEINIGLIGSLMHDTGYIQQRDDSTGTGAKYTLVHILRSIRFIQDYYKNDIYFRNDLGDFADILNCTGFSIDIDKIVFSSLKMEIMGKILGTADLLGQMADRFYLEKLVYLFYEFDEARVPGFDSEIDLLRKTINFYNMTKSRFQKNLSNVNRFMIRHFEKRWQTNRNLYDEAIEKNINYLKYILKSNQKNISVCLRRNAITIQ